jgi:hypothetical protein
MPVLSAKRVAPTEQALSGTAEARIRQTRNGRADRNESAPAESAR